MAIVAEIFFLISYLGLMCCVTDIPKYVVSCEDLFVFHFGNEFILNNYTRCSNILICSDLMPKLIKITTINSIILYIIILHYYYNYIHNYKYKYTTIYYTKLIILN